MQGFDENAQRPHHHGGNDEDEDGAFETWHDDVWRETEPDFDLMEQADRGSGRGGGVDHTMQVYKRCVAHHATERVEDEEGHHIEHEAEQQAVRHLPEVLGQSHAAVSEVVDRQA